MGETTPNVASIGNMRSGTDLWAQRITRVLTRFMCWFSQHWVLFANTALALYLALPFLAPVLAHAGHDWWARAVYLVFRPLCHQIPERSFYLFGRQLVYSYAELSELLGGVVPQRHIGNDDLGYKVAVCQRDVAIYGFALLSGLLFAPLRQRVKTLPLKRFGLMIVPMAIDGIGQLLGLWESSWWSRVLTGGLFGLACVWLAFPYLETGMRGVHRDAARAVAQWDRRG
jgi:uncharacterized membrane protein